MSSLELINTYFILCRPKIKILRFTKKRKHEIILHRQKALTLEMLRLEKWVCNQGDTYDGRNHSLSLEHCGFQKKYLSFKIFILIQAQWCSLLMPALGSQREVNLCEFQDCLVYIVSPNPRTASDKQWDPVWNTAKTNKQKE